MLAEKWTNTEAPVALPDEAEIHERNLRVYRETGDADSIREIARAIRNEESRLRNEYPLLQRQNLLGLSSFVAAASIFLAAGGAYVAGWIPAWSCIIIGAIATSLIREIEHDLTHHLYFKDRPRVQNLMMAAVWPFLGNLPNPWYRRKVHHLHHRASGQPEDLEERSIGNGMPFGFKRLVTTIDLSLGLLLRRKEMESIPAYDFRQALIHFFPVGFVYYAIILGFIGLHGAEWSLSAATEAQPAWLGRVMPLFDVGMVVYVLPNWLRQFCLQVLSSNMHYYSDVKNRLQETQVLDAWYFWPLQLFTFNFGATHGIHHFVVNQPFYLRQMCAVAAHRAMRSNQVRFNDLGSFFRGNRYESVVLKNS